MDFATLPLSCSRIFVLMMIEMTIGWVGGICRIKYGIVRCRDGISIHTCGWLGIGNPWGNLTGVDIDNIDRDMLRR